MFYVISCSKYILIHHYNPMLLINPFTPCSLIYVFLVITKDALVDKTHHKHSIYSYTLLLRVVFFNLHNYHKWFKIFAAAVVKSTAIFMTWLKFALKWHTLIIYFCHIWNSIPKPYKYFADNLAKKIKILQNSKKYFVSF